MRQREQKLAEIQKRIRAIYDESDQGSLTPAQKSEVKELRSLYRTINMRRDLPKVRRWKRRSKGSGYEPGTPVKVRSVVSGGLPGLGRRS